MPRLILTDIYWKRLQPILIDQGIYNKANLRDTVEGILYRLRTGCPWRDLPKYFGHWHRIFKRFNDWSKSEKLVKIFQSLVTDPDYEWSLIDGSVVKAHQHSTGARKGVDIGIGKTVAGNSSKIHLATDSFGLPVEIKVTEGQVHDSQIALDIIKSIPKGTTVIADRGYDSSFIRSFIRAKGGNSIIPYRELSNKKKILNSKLDWGTYKVRHLVENAFARLKHMRAIATRYDKLRRNYEGMVLLGCIIMWLPL